MLPHQQRVIDEKAELDSKITKLSAFLADPVKCEPVPIGEHALMTWQLSAMIQYSECLARRIAIFNRAAA